MNIGLSSDVLEQIATVLRQNPAVERAILYGSRAMGTYRSGSDIDMAVAGKDLTFNGLLALMNQLEDLDLLYSFDVQQYEKIQNTDLIDHINRVGICIFSSTEKSD